MKTTLYKLPTDAISNCSLCNKQGRHTIAMIIEEGVKFELRFCNTCVQNFQERLNYLHPPEKVNCCCCGNELDTHFCDACKS